MVRFRRKKNVNVMRVGVKVVGTVIALYASGFMLTIIGNIMLCTNSPFYTGLRLIGWTIQDNVVINATSSTVEACNTTIPINGITAGSYNSVISSTAGTGILAVIGLLAIIWIIFEFVNIQM